MRATSVTLFVGLLFLWCGVHGALNCRDKASVDEEQLKCFSRTNITLLDQDIQDILNAIQYKPELVCSIEEEYKRAIVCVFDIAKECFQQFSIRTDVLSDVGKLTDGIAFMCQHVSEVNTECFRNSQKLIEQCTVIQSLTLVGQSSDVGNIICGTFQIAYNCSKENLDLCPGRTLEVNLKLINEFIRPPACSTFDNDNNNYTNTTVHVGRSVSDAGNCDLTEKIPQCLVEAGVTLPDLSVIGGGLINPINPTSLNISQITFIKQFLNLACKQKEGYKRALRCYLDALKECFRGSDALKLVPDPSKFDAIIDDVCNYADDINFQCVVNVADDLQTCVSGKLQLGGDIATGADITKIFCKTVLYATECTLQELPECGCRTTQLFIRTLKNIHHPVCTAVQNPTPECDPTTGEFVESDAERLRYGLPTLAMLAITWFGLV